MNKYLKYIIGITALSMLTNFCWAETQIINNAMQNFQAAGASVNAKLIQPAIATACAALTIQWILTHWKDIFNGDLSNTLAKSVGLVTWFGATVALIRHQEVLSNAYTGYLTLSGNLAGVSASDFTPGAVIGEAKTVITAVNSAVWRAAGNNGWQITETLGTAITVVVINIVVATSFFMIALSLFVTNLEFWMMFAVAPLAFGLIPLTAFRDQGFAPIKGVISIGLRILILGVVVAVAKQMTESCVSGLNSFAIKENESLIAAMLEYLAGMFGCALMSLSAGKIASSIASGTANFSGSDAIKGGMAIAGVAAAGAAIAAPFLAPAAKGAMNGMGAAAKGIGNGISKGIEAFQNRGSGSVSPGGAPGGGMSNGFGGPPTRERPSFESSMAEANKSSSSNSPVSSSPGNAGSAGISGSGPNAEPPKGPSALDKIGDSMGKAANHHSQDGHSVGVQMHISKE
jgi:hypothetical protein